MLNCYTLFTFTFYLLLTLTVGGAYLWQCLESLWDDAAVSEMSVLTRTLDVRLLVSVNVPLASTTSPESAV